MAKKKIRNKKELVRKYVFIGTILAYPMALFLLMYIYVNINSFAMAFQKVNIDGSIFWVGLQNFAEFFNKMFGKDADVLSISLINSLKMYIINFAICMPLYIFFSYLLFKKVRRILLIKMILMICCIINMIDYLYLKE